MWSKITVKLDKLHVIKEAGLNISIICLFLLHIFVQML